jgi:ribosome biogenesis protein ENP2
MKLTNPHDVPVYTISGASTARPLPDWLIRKRKRSLKNDEEFANRGTLLRQLKELESCLSSSYVLFEIVENHSTFKDVLP